MFSDTAEAPGPGLASYLRIVARDPARGVVAVQQLDEILTIGLFSEEIADEIAWLPEIRPPMGMSVEDCLRISRSHISRVLQDPSQVSQENPQNSWEWKERFPALGQLLGAYLNQDFPDFYDSWQEAVDDYRNEMDGDDVRNSVNEITELLAIVRSDEELEQATDALGLELLPPKGTNLRQWLESMRHRMTATA
ncbi:contact-dependent growth inhibition system immunity protein [Streptomyces sp. NPDC001351]|uniref:contact-dependent growth inhibition system immunity protein n=1 Tax=Streptomyces sp. NPDC001351 TaxID=3364564 RepID=UPI0036B7EA59